MNRRLAAWGLGGGLLVGLGPNGLGAAQETIHVEARILCPVIVRMPPPASGSPPPLLVVLHGKGGTSQGMASLWNVLENPKPVLVAPPGPYPLLVPSEKGAVIGSSWDFPSPDRALWDIADPLVVTYILDTIHAVRKAHKTGGVYVMGHSQGAAYAYRVALREPDLIRGVMAMAGVIGEELLPVEAFRRAAGKVSIFIAHGRQDEAISPDRSRQAKAFLEKFGFSVTYREFEGGHGLTAGIGREAHAWMLAQERAATRAPAARPGSSPGEPSRASSSPSR